ncbi:hypothetical protein PIB30_079575 [Stylosanthes scabra]|uniref:NAB domain-containing protein n=1 Tax=Stylosanthes scabra TaxID=79078 RepID=A0ABU6ZPX3_9FABA|nr:hypothetical protein [Stylosanthes scabra]
MEEKVLDTLQTLNDEGDSFATRAEMYYKKRPELVDFVEESFRAYRALAERYDKLSKDLQSANRTIASVFPDQVQYRTEEEDEDEEEAGSNNGRPNDTNTKNNETALIPEAPSIPKKGHFRSPSMLLSKKGPPPKRTSSSCEKDFKVSSSVLSKNEALSEIDKIQKEILTLQTEKEFVRSLYERAYQQYWEFEDRITAMQKSVCTLQDEYGVGTVIEDDEARTLMAAAALKSCQDTLAKLQEIQAQSSKEARVEFERVKEAHEMFEKLRDQFISKYYLNQDESNTAKPTTPVEKEEVKEMDDAGIRGNVKGNKLEEDSSEVVITVTEMADRINQLVKKVVTLETAVSSQTGLVQRLRSETDELQTNIKKLEEEKEVLMEGSEVTNQKLKEVEEELKRVKLLNRTVQSQDNSIRTHFIEASFDVKHLSEKLNNMKPDVEEKNMVLYKKNKNENNVVDGDKEDVKTTLTEDDVGGDAVPEGVQNMSSGDGEIESHDLSSVDSNKGDEPNWRQLYISGLDDREKILLEEYTSVLRDYKDVKIKLNDVEKKNRDSLFEMALQRLSLSPQIFNIFSIFRLEELED